MTNTSYRYLFYCCFHCFIGRKFCERSTTEKRILIVQSYEPDFQAYKDIEEAFKKGFQKKAFPASIFTFYLNCEAYQSPEEKQRIYTELNTLSFMEARYHNRKR